MKNQTLLFLVIFSLILLNNCQTSHQKNSLSPQEQEILLSKGNLITQQSFKAFSGELMKALQDGDVQYAVEFCHLKANPIIDSLSNAYSIKISRVSDKYRNPANMPGKLDLTVIDGYRKQLEQGQKLNPHIEITSVEVVYYSPIIISNPVCLLCHGEPGLNMDRAGYDFIKSRYSNDLAYGYKIGDLRGLWKIIFLPK